MALHSINREATALEVESLATGNHRRSRVDPLCDACYYGVTRLSGVVE